MSTVESQMCDVVLYAAAGQAESERYHAGQNFDGSPWRRRQAPVAAGERDGRGRSAAFARECGVNGREDAG
jgi:hypothetical protein